MPRLRSVCALILLAATPASAGRLTFERIVPARHDLGGAQNLLITFAIADNDKISTFLDVFIEQTNRGDTLRVVDVTRIEHSPERSHRWRRAPKYIEQRSPADAFLRIESFTCQTTSRSGEGGTYDVDGNRVRKTQRWVDAVCQAHIDAISKRSGKKIAEVTTRGEGTSPRADVVTDGERDIAMDQAARYSAVAAAEEITPRRVRETITLVEDAPRFEEAMAMIDADRFAEARRVWERAVPANPNSASLHFDLAAVCEALGDLTAAEHNYMAAQSMAPKDRRYRDGYEAFRRRYGRKK
jgi:tetratricopeptide (TPR) repeat protein